MKKYKLLDQYPPEDYSFYTTWKVLFDKFNNNRISKRSIIKYLEKCGWSKYGTENDLFHMENLGWLIKVK